MQSIDVGACPCLKVQLVDAEMYCWLLRAIVERLCTSNCTNMAFISRASMLATDGDTKGMSTICGFE